MAFIGLKYSHFTPFKLHSTNSSTTDSPTNHKLPLKILTPKYNSQTTEKMSGMNAVTTVVASLIIIIFVIVFIIFVPGYMGIRFERRRIAAQNNLGSMNWPFPAQQEQEQHQQPRHEYDIEMNDWPLRCPEPALTRRPSDWPLRRMEPVVMPERRRESVKNVRLESGSPGGDLEGFPYYVR